MTSEVISTADFLLRDDEPVARARARKRLAGALLVSGFLHAAVLAVLIGVWQREAPEEIPLPPIPVTLTEDEGAAGAAGDSNGASSASSASEARVAAPAPPDTQPAAMPETPPTPRNVATPTPPRAVDAIEPVPQRKPTPPKPAPKPVETAQALTPVLRAPAPPAAPAPSTVPASVDALLHEGVGGSGRGTEGIGRAAYGAGAIEAPGDDYLDLVRAWIARYKKYPDAALAKKQEGKAMLGFIIDRNGDALNAWIDQSSGNPLLDEATLAMIHNASPIPKVPDKYKGDTLRLFMPVNYSIGLFDRLFKSSQ